MLIGTFVAIGLWLAIAPASYAGGPPVQVTVNVTGQGTVLLNGTTPCRATCNYLLSVGQTLTFAGNPDHGWSFDHWDGDCSGSGSCSFLLTDAAEVDATFHDDPVPAATITSPADGATVEVPAGASNAAQVVFSLPAAGLFDPSKTECLVDDVKRFAGAECTSPFATGLLNSGTHSVSIRLDDGSVGSSTSEATSTFTVVNLPDTKVISKPPAVTASKSATFSYSGGDGVRCALDPANPANPSLDQDPCPTTFSGLADGVHRLFVRSYVTVNGVKYDGDLETVAWRVDTTPPDTVIDSQALLPTVTTVRTITFRFHAVDGGATTFQCSLGDASFGACPGGVAGQATYANLPVGARRFRVRAIDAVGLVDATPASWSWTVLAADADHDGFFSPGVPNDCDDHDAGIHPGAIDVPDDGVDQDCSGHDAIDLDRDHDGVNRPTDCDDNDASTHPGAKDTPGDGIDQDCSGHDARIPPVSGGVSYKFTNLAAKTTIITLRLKNLRTRGTRVTVTCKGRACPFHTRKARPAKSHLLDVKKLVHGAAFDTGQALVLTITAPHHVTKVIAFKMRFGQTPSGGAVLCRPRGAKRARACGRA